MVAMSNDSSPGSSTGPIRTAVLGYGVSGRVFHAPFVEHDPRFSLEAIVTGNPERAAAAKATYPSAKVLPDADAVFADPERFDLVVIGTPPGTHVDLATRAIEAGIAVVVDKPFCATRAEAQGLADLAAEHGVPLVVFQNRRWDGDFRTVRALIDDGRLGEVRRFESGFEVWKPGRDGWKSSTGPADAGGILYDLGSHLVDQAVQLFGPVVEMHAELLAHGTPGVDDDAFVALVHEDGVHSHLSMSRVTGQPGPRFRVLGSQGAFTKWGLDPQEAALVAGATPADDGFGHEPEDHWGLLGAGDELTPVPTEPSSYAEFYAALAAHLLDGAPPPVDIAEAVEVVGILEELHRRFPVANG